MADMQNKSDKCLTCPAYENICEAMPDDACKRFQEKLETLKKEIQQDNVVMG